MAGNEGNNPVTYQSLIDWDLEDLLQRWEDYKYSIFSLLDDYFSKYIKSTLLVASYCNLLGRDSHFSSAGIALLYEVGITILQMLT